RIARVAGLVARGVAVGRRCARISRMPRTVAGLARIGAVAEDTIVARRAVGLELTDTPPDVVAVIAVRALVPVEARCSLPHELAVELAAAEREVAVGPPGTLGARRARGQGGIAVAVELPARVALLPALDDPVAAGTGRPGNPCGRQHTRQQDETDHDEYERVRGSRHGRLLPARPVPGSVFRRQPKSDTGTRGRDVSAALVRRRVIHRSSPGGATGPSFRKAKTGRRYDFGRSGSFE